MLDNEIHVSWIKTLDPKYKSLFCYTFFLLCLEWYFRIIQTHTEVTPDYLVSLRYFKMQITTDIRR